MNCRLREAEHLRFAYVRIVMSVGFLLRSTLSLSQDKPVRVRVRDRHCRTGIAERKEGHIEGFTLLPMRASRSDTWIGRIHYTASVRASCPLDRLRERSESSPERTILPQVRRHPSRVLGFSWPPVSRWRTYESAHFCGRCDWRQL
jgi:hypothetical protein